MVIKYKKPEELMNELLFQNFKNNQYFKFLDFVQQVKSTQSQKKIDYDMIKEFIYDMIDKEKIEQIYIDENENPFLQASEKRNNGEKSIHFKIIVARNEN